MTQNRNFIHIYEPRIILFGPFTLIQKKLIIESTLFHKTHLEIIIWFHWFLREDMI